MVSQPQAVTDVILEAVAATSSASVSWPEAIYQAYLSE
jgi:hypothetical protein